MHLNIVVSSESENTELENRKRISTSALKNTKKFLLTLNSSLPWTDNKVLSMVCRGKYSIREIATLTGLDRCKSIQPALERLALLGLAELKDGAWIGLQPTDMTLFTTWENPKATHWFQRVSYFPVFTPADSFLNTRANDLFCRILNYPGKLPAWYASVLQIPVRTIKRLLHGYQGLIDARLIYQDHNHACYVPKLIPDFWQDQVKISAVPNAIIKYLADLDANGQTVWLTRQNEGIDIVTAQSKRLATFLTAKQQQDFWRDSFHGLKDAYRIELFLCQLGRIIDHVEANGKFKPNYLKSTAKLVTEHLQRRPFDNVATFFGWTFDPKGLFS